MRHVELAPKSTKRPSATDLRGAPFRLRGAPFGFPCNIKLLVHRRVPEVPEGWIICAM
jgi:hypothetical protein